MPEQSRTRLADYSDTVSVGRPCLCCESVVGKSPDNLPAEFRARSAILDGEIVYVDCQARPSSKTWRGEPRFYPFDLQGGLTLKCDNVAWIGRKAVRRSFYERRLRSAVLGTPSFHPLPLYGFRQDTPKRETLGMGNSERHKSRWLLHRDNPTLA